MIARVPLGEQVLVKRTEFLRVGGAGCRGLAPDMRKSGLERCIRDLADGSMQVLWRDESLLGIHQFPITDSMVASTDALESNIGSQSVKTKQKTFLEGCRVQVLTGRRAGKKIGKMGPKICLFEHIE